MRTVLILSVVAALAACDDSQPTTAPTKARAVSARAAEPSADVGVNPQNKPLQSGGFTTVTVVNSTDYSIPYGAVAGQAVCPAGTTRIGGGYAFVNEGNWSAPPTVTQSMPWNNGWWVRALNGAIGAQPASFRVYALCAS